jgi:hypothetical protein
MPTIATATAFFQPGVSEIVWINSVATPALPTAAEINAGTKLLNEVYDVAGFAQTTAWIERRRAGSRTRTQLAGASTFEGSSITFTMDKAGGRRHREFTVGQTGFAAVRRPGPGRRQDRRTCTSCEVGAVVPLRNYDNDYPRIRVDYGLNAYNGVTIPVGRGLSHDSPVRSRCGRDDPATADPGLDALEAKSELVAEAIRLGVPSYEAWQLSDAELAAITNQAQED